MKITITAAKELASNVLIKFGFTTEESEYCIENCLDGELSGKKTHGFVRIPKLVKSVQAGDILVGGKDISVIKETAVSLLIDGQKKTGLYVVNKALEKAIAKAKTSGIVAAGVTNTAQISGLIGQYARKATENDLIYIGFNNSSGGLIPHGSIKDVFGTNPFTVGIPANEIPVILDMASSKITWGSVFLAKAIGTTLPEGSALDGKGTPTNDPTQALDGGLLPFAEHKGSGLAFIVEILGGALTASRVGNNVEGGWGSFFILIDPNILRPIDEFKKDVESLINEVKSSPKQKGIKEIYYPGEQSLKKRLSMLEKGEFELNDQVHKDLVALQKEK